MNLREWATARIIQEYNFPTNAAAAIVAKVVNYNWPVMPWASRVDELPEDDKNEVWSWVHSEIDLMARTDLTEAHRIRVFDGGSKVIHEGKDADGLKVLFVRAAHMDYLEEHIDKIRVPGRQVMVRLAGKNTWRIFTQPLFTKGKP